MVSRETKFLFFLQSRVDPPIVKESILGKTPFLLVVRVSREKSLKAILLEILVPPDKTMKMSLRWKDFLIGTILSLAFVPDASAQSDRLDQKYPGEEAVSEITIEELQNIAVSQHPLLSRLHFETRAALGEWVQSGLYPNPELLVEFEEFSDRGNWGSQKIGLSQEILAAQKRQLARNAAKSQLNWSQKKHAAEFLALRNEVRIKSYEYLAARKTVEIQSELLRINEQSLQAAEKMKAVNEVSLVDVLQIRSKKNEAALELRKAINDEEMCWSRLATALGNPQLPKSFITDSLEMGDWELNKEIAWSTILSESPEIQLSNIDIQTAHSVLQREIAERRPNFSVEATYGYDSNEKESFGTVGMSVPLQFFNRNQGNIQKSRAELSVANRQRDTLILELRDRFLDSFNQYENAKQSVDAYKNEILPDVRMNLDLCVKGYKQGEFSYLDLLFSQQGFTEAQLMYVRSLKDLAVSQTKIEGLLYLKSSE